MDSLQPLALIVAMTRSRVIGRHGALPWHHSADLKRFRRITTGHAVIMGRRTHESIGRPLPDRRNIVISRSRELRLEGCEVAHSIAGALTLARSTDPQPIVIGGAEIYARALPLATRLYITFVEEEVAGDAFFPEVAWEMWREVEHQVEGGLTFCILERQGV